MLNWASNLWRLVYGSPKSSSRVRLSLECLEDRAVPAALGIAADYNLFALGNVSQQWTDVGGRVAVAGNATYNGLGFGTALTDSNGTRDDLIVGGSLTFNNGQVYNGNIVSGSTPTLNSVGIPNGTARVGSVIDFAAAAQALRDESADIAALEVNGVTENRWGGLFLTGTNAELNVFTVPASQLGSAWGLTISAPAGSSVVVNVTGTTAQWQYMGVNLQGIDSTDVIYNFNQATSLTIQGISVQGSVLAPNAAVQFNNGNLYGTLVAGSLSGQGELHSSPNDVDLPDDPEEPVIFSLSGTVYFDQNEDGELNADETGQSGAVITLYRGSVIVGTFTTGTDGRFTFTGLEEGTYRLVQSPPPPPAPSFEFRPGSATPGDAGGVGSTGTTQSQIAQIGLGDEEDDPIDADFYFFGNILTLGGQE